MREEFGRAHAKVRQLEKAFTAKEAKRSHTLRFPVERTLVEVQREVGAHFGWADDAVLYQIDHHGWEIPVSSQGQLSAILEEWESGEFATVAPRGDAMFAFGGLRSINDWAIVRGEQRQIGHLLRAELHALVAHEPLEAAHEDPHLAIQLRRGRGGWSAAGVAAVDGCHAGFGTGAPTLRRGGVFGGNNVSCKGRVRHGAAARVGRAPGCRC